MNFFVIPGKKGGDVFMKRHTRPRGHVRSQRYRIPPEHHGFSARGEKRPQWARPWPQQRSHGAAGRHQRREQRQREPRKKPTQNLSTSRPTREDEQGGEKGSQRHYDNPLSENTIDIDIFEGLVVCFGWYWYRWYIGRDGDTKNRMGWEET